MNKSAVAPVTHNADNAASGPNSRVQGLSPTCTTTRVQRLDADMLRAQGIASRCLADAMGVHRCSLESMSQACGCSIANLRKWLDTDDSSTISVGRLIVAARTRRHVVLSFLAAIRSHLDTEVLPKEPPMPISQRMLGVMAETGDLATSIRNGLADGVLDDDEKVSVLREIEHLRTQLDGLERDLRRA